MPILSRIGAAAARGFGMLGKLAAAVDPYFKYVTLLLHGNGTNGAQNNTFLDSSTNNFTITRNGNTTQGTFAPYGSNWGNYFNGTNAYLSVSSAGTSLTLTGNFTIEMWMYRASNTLPSFLNYQQFICSGNNVDSFKQGTVGDGWYFVGGGTPYFFSTNPNIVPVGQWTHVAWVRSGSTITMYVNGSSVGSITYSSTIDYGTTLNIGAGGSEYYYGYMSNVRIVKGTALYTAAFTPPTSPLTAITNTSLLTCQSNRFIDNSSNAFTITRNGDVSVQRFSPFSPTAAYSTSVIGGSGYFDGSGDYLKPTVATPSEIGTGDFSISFWVYATAADPSFQIIADTAYNGGGFSSGWVFQINSATGFSFYIGGASGANALTATGVNLRNSWNYIEVSRSGTTAYLFVNGALVTSATRSNNGSSGLTAAIGSQQSGGSTVNSPYFAGYIADFRIVKSVGNTAAYTAPSAPLTAITNTSLLTNFTNAGIIDNAMMNDLETVGNAQISTAQSKFGGGSMYFDGSGDALTAPPSINLAMGSGDFTIEMWVNGANSGSTVGGAYPRIFQLGAAQTSSTIECYNAAGTFYVEVGLSNFVTFTASTLLNSTWNHFAVSRAGSSLKVFVNGTQVGSTLTSTANLTSPTTNTSFIGASTASSGNFNGYIDDLRITKGYARYTANFTPPTAALPDQ